MASKPDGPRDMYGMAAMLDKYLEALAVKNYSQATTHGRRVYLNYFIGWAEERGITRPCEVTKPILERFQRYLFHHRKKNGDPLSVHSQTMYLACLRAWFKWLTKENHLLYNPASELESPRTVKKLPHILSAKDVDHLLNQADITTTLGIRDRAMLETFYSTGIRRQEMIRLGVFDISLEQGTVMVRQGKNKKDRLIPIGDRAIAWVRRYLDEVRPGLLIGDDARDVLFLTDLGTPFTPHRLSQLVHRYVAAAGLGKRGSCHLFRHAMATLMLEGGADLRFVQAMLGHENLATTQIYTQVSIRKLKDIHTATHPAKLQRNPDQSVEE